MTPQRAAPASDSPQAQYRRRKREELAAFLKLVEGLMISTHPDCPHGQPEGYDLYGCRCDQCAGSSATIRVQAHRERGYRDTARAVLVQHELGLDDDALEQIVTEAVQLWRTGRGRRRAVPIEQMLGAHCDDDRRCERASVALVDALTTFNQPATARKKPRKGVVR